MGSETTNSYLSRGYDETSHLGNSMTDATSYSDGLPVRQSTSRPQSAYGNHDDLDYDRTSSVQQLENAGLRRTASASSRSGTLKKKNSVSRKGSLKRSGSKRSVRAGSIKGVDVGGSQRDPAQVNSIFYTPIPTSGSPTEVLANRFQAWRKMLKDLIAYFREVQAFHEHRGKALLKVSNIINNLAIPPGFLADGGLHEAHNVLRDYHRQGIAEANKATDIETDVISHLNGLRQDLAAKIKEIKSLSGDFKNSVDKEKDGTRKAVQQLEEALQVAEHDPAAMLGKDDPFIVRLAVERQVERQIDEENYLHRAYLNLEGSGRELESIVVGEIQKAYNAFAGILKREADEAYDAVEKLRSGPISLAKDFEWNNFVENDPHFINPEIPLRKVEDIEYPGKDAPAAAEVRAGMLERKSKYLKSYTPGWYVLSPTHLHEFKSADRIYTQPPVMSLFLSDQKLGSKSSPDSSSHKFMIKGKQTGSMHRGHSWVFRAESYDTMLAWYDDIKLLTEGSMPEKTAFVRKHARSTSVGSVSGESVMDEDEADQVPFSKTATRDMAAVPAQEELSRPQRPSPGGRFPSDFQGNQYLRTPGGDRAMSPSSGSSIDDRDTAASTTGPPGGTYAGGTSSIQQSPVVAQGQQGFQQRHQPQPLSDGADNSAAGQFAAPQVQRHDSNYGAWLGGAAAGAGLGVAGEEYWRQKHATDNTEAADAAPVHSKADADAEKVAAATAMPPGIIGDAAVISAAETGQRERQMSLDDTAATGVGSTAAGLSTVVSNTGIEDGGSAPGKELAVQAPEPVSAPAVADSTKTAVPNGGAVAAMDPIAAQVDEGLVRTAYDTDPLDGSVNAHATGAIFPRVLRHNTNVSVADLHVPGEWK